MGFPERSEGRARVRAGLCAAALTLALASPAARAQGGPAPAAASAIAPAAAPTLSAGDALRMAVAALRGGETARAATLLEAAAREHPVIADHADLLRARALLEGGAADEALAAARQGLERSPQSPLRSDLFAVLGDAFERAGQDAEARRAWESAASLTTHATRLAALRARDATSLERSGQGEAAAEVWRLVWREHPTSPEARHASGRLDALEAALGRRVRSAADHRARGDALFRVGWSEEALRDYEAALGAALGPAARRAVLARRAHCLFRLRRYPEATAAFEALAPDAEAALWRARSIARSGDVPRGIAELEVLAARAPAPTAQQARWLAALLLDDAGESARAEALYAAVAQGAGDASRIAEARWRLGWSAYRKGDFGVARRELERMAAAEPDPITRLQARYWQARAMEQAREAGAPALYAELAGEYPFTYYGWRAQARLAPGASVAARPRPVPSGTAALAPRELARPRILLEAGLESEAREELDRLRGRSRGLADRLELARLYADARAYERAQSLVVSGYADVLARGPASGDEELWWTAWPLAYAELVRGYSAGPGAPEPALVWAVMREESGYQPSVVSPAGARGLLQIMPSTGERLAQQVGLAPFSPEDLFRPEVNVRLGAAYLGGLTSRFDGRLSAAIGSYNAGPEAIARWLEERPSQDDDEWVESMPYEQTRTYVRRVLRSLHAYRVLYR